MKYQHDPQSAAKSVAAFAHAYGLGIATVWRKIKSGELRANKVGARTIITAAAEQEWVANLPPARGAA